MARQGERGQGNRTTWTLERSKTNDKDRYDIYQNGLQRAYVIGQRKSRKAQYHDGRIYWTDVDITITWPRRIEDSTVTSKTLRQFAKEVIALLEKGRGFLDYVYPAAYSKFVQGRPVGQSEMVATATIHQG